MNNDVYKTIIIYKHFRAIIEKNYNKYSRLDPSIYILYILK